MSEARHQRFEIDLDEIERQLRRSVDAAPAPAADPLAELARIVGQDDPFRRLLGETPPAAKAPVQRQDDRFGLNAEQDAVLHGTRAPAPSGDHLSEDELFDPVVDAYGSADGAIEGNDLMPLRPRRTRRRLAGVMAVLALIVVGTGGFLVWRKAGHLGLSGPPPIIKADTSPIKVAPEHPGGIEIPNQNKQIYQPDAPEGKTRVVDDREQPMDVKEAVRDAPAPPRLTPDGALAGGQVASLPTSAPIPGSQAIADPMRTPAQASVANALGEPLKVRTVSVRPDGTMFATPAARMAASSPAMSILTSSLPPPVPVATIPIGPAASPGVEPAATPSSAQGAGDSATTPSAGPAPVTVLPPQRPKPGERRSSIAPPAATASRLAAGAPEPETTGSQGSASLDDAAAAPAPAPAGSYSVQIAVMPSEEQARKAYGRLAGRYAGALGGKPANVIKAEVRGKTLYRVRVGPMAHAGANELCTRLKAAGASCFVAAN